MTNENRRLSISLELRHGREALAAARALRDLGMRNDALSRLYYALFRHLVALLLTEGVEPTRHHNLPGLLGLHFVLRGALSAADVAVVGRVFGYRSLADYERTWDATEEVLVSAFADVDPLLVKVDALLDAGGWRSP